MNRFLLPYLISFLLCSGIHGVDHEVQSEFPRTRRLQAFDGDCTAVVKTIEYPIEALNNTNKLELACQHKGKYYIIPEADEQFIRKHFFDGPFVSGETKINIGSDAKIDMDSLELVTAESIQISDFSQNTRLITPRSSTGNKSVLIVKIVAVGGQNSFSESELRDSILGTSGDPVNMKSQYNACSHGKLNLQAKGSVSGSSTSISNGVVTISVGTSLSQGENNLVSAVSSEIYNQFDDYYYNIADHVLYCMPPNVMGGIAWAYIGGTLSVYNNDWCTYPSVLLHEVGHNLGLLHSGEDDYEYDDQSCMMGYSYSDDDSPQMCFNAAKMWQLGWFSARSLTLSSSGTLNYIGNLADMTQNPDDTSGPPIVIRLQTSSSKEYFLTYNRAVGFNSGVIEGRNEVRIIETTSTNSLSMVAASLSNGNSWTSGNEFGSQRVEVTVNSIGTLADVSICIGSCNSTPSPTPSPGPCIDSKLRFLVNGILRPCSWVAQKNTSKRCGKARGRVAAHCPSTCGQCNTLRCVDAKQRFALKENGNLKSCTWVRRKDTVARCNKIDVETVCRETCASTECPNSCVNSPENWYDSDGETFNCEWYAQDNNCAAYGDMFENFGKTANEACCVCGGGDRT